MGRKKIAIPFEQLYDLYVTQRLTPAKIGALLGCDGITIRNRLKEAGIPFRTPSDARNRYPKYDFTCTETEKAYMLGFRYGDLNVYKPSPVSSTIVIRCHTTHKVQEDLFRTLFERYGKITASHNARSVHINCYVNSTFEFMLPKYHTEMEQWIYEKDDRSWAFSAGYIDAEGTFGLYENRGRFKVDAYDLAILKKMHEFYLQKGIKSLFRKIGIKGEPAYGYLWNEDLWRLTINEAKTLELFISKVGPYILHAKRKDDMLKVEKNVILRNNHAKNS